METPPQRLSQHPSPTWYPAWYTIAHHHPLFKRLEQHAQADGKAAYFRLHRYRYASIIAQLDAPPHTPILEIGTTPGQFTRLLVESGYRVAGVDLDPSTRSALWQQLGVDVRQANLEQEAIPFPDGAFEWVIFSEVIEHLVYSPLPLLRDIRRVLRPGGHLIITTPNELYLKSRLRTLIRLLLWQSLLTPKEFRTQMLLEGHARYTTHSRTYTMKELCWLLEHAGFTIRQHRYEATWEYVGLEPHRLMQHPLGVIAKALVTLLTALIRPTRSMLLVHAQTPHSAK